MEVFPRDLVCVANDDKFVFHQIQIMRHFGKLTLNSKDKNPSKTSEHALTCTSFSRHRQDFQPKHVHNASVTATVPQELVSHLFLSRVCHFSKKLIKM